MLNFTQDRVFGLIAVAFGLFIALYWAQVDTETGLFERVRGRSSVGDALAPTVAGTILALAGAWLALTAGAEQRLTTRNFGYVAALGACLILSLGLMRWGGPILVEMITGAEYRPLRDTPPWKYFGFILGGTCLVALLISLVEGQVRLSRVLIAILVSLGLALFYDVPFEDLILPPNGDV